MTTDNYKDAVLKAINLGGDTDTTGAVTGGLAGLYYGHETIPTRWINANASKEDIEELVKRLSKKLFWNRENINVFGSIPSGTTSPKHKSRRINDLQGLF